MKPGFGGDLLVLSGLVLGLCLLLALLMRRQSKGVRRFKEGHVTGIVGRKGHGKTIYSVHELLRHLGQSIPCRKCADDVRRGLITEDEIPRLTKTKVRHGVTGLRVWHEAGVASNGTLYLADKYVHLWHKLEGWEDLYSLPHGTLCAIDEVHLGWAPARQGEQLTARATYMLAQCRKYVLEIIWLAQHEDRTALGLRRQTDEYGMCQKGLFRQMRVKFYEPEEARKRDVKPSWSYRYRVTRKLGAAYSTYQLLDVAKEEPEPAPVSPVADMVARRRQGSSAAGGATTRTASGT